jgi:hypothetical protein
MHPIDRTIAAKHLMVDLEIAQCVAFETPQHDVLHVDVVAVLRRQQLQQNVPALFTDAVQMLFGRKLACATE